MNAVGAAANDCVSVRIRKIEVVRRSRFWE